MIVPFSDAAQSAIGSLPGGTLPLSFVQGIAPQFEAARTDIPNESLGQALTEQQALADKVGDTGLPSAAATLNAYIHAKQGGADAAASQKLLDLYNNRVGELKGLYPDQPWRSTDELQQYAADTAAATKKAAAEAATRETPASAVASTLVGGLGAQLTDPLQLATLLTPMDAEAFGGSLIARLGKLGLTQGLVQGSTEAAEQLANRDFYRAQGMSEDEINAQLWRSVGGSALGGAIFAPALEVGRLGVGKAFDWLRGGNLDQKSAAIDALSQGNLSSDQRADLANQRDAIDWESRNPFQASPQSNRVFAGTLDDYVDQIERGGVDPFLHTTDTSSVALRQVEPRFELSDEAAAQLGLTPGRAAPEEINASLQLRLARGKAEHAQGLADQAGTDLETARQQVDDLIQQRAAITGELNKDIPSAQALQAAGVDPDTAARLQDIQEQMSGRMSNRARAALQAEHDTITESIAPEIEQAKANLVATAKSLDEQAIPDAQAQYEAATRTKAQRDAALSEAQRQAGQFERTLSNLQARKSQAPGFNPEEAARMAEQRPVFDLDQFLARRREARRPITEGELADHAAQADAVASGKYDGGLIDDARAYLEENGDIVLKDPVTGEPFSVRDALKNFEHEEAALREIMSCIAGGS